MISGFPLLVFTVLTGIACGTYVASAAFAQKESDRLWLFPLIALILLAVGGLAAVGHLGRPALMFNMFNNLASPLMIEGMFTAAMCIVAIADLVICRKGAANQAVRIAGAVVGLVFMCFVTNAYLTCYGTPGWCATATLPLFVLGDLAAGFGLWALLNGTEGKQAYVAAVLAVLFTLNLAWEAVSFNGMGLNGVTPIIVGAVLAVIAAAADVLQARKPEAKTMTYVASVAIIVALVVSRYGFYMSCPF